ncbi:MAG: tryptophan 2,3-dioxygenase [Proteobacteria bacterium]|nr:MAG: tryptophan 2,3-dioxygenase [Pseudomonadota bacterium]
MSNGEHPLNGEQPSSGEKPSIYKKTDLTYNDYLKVPELIGLQQPLSQPEHHDEMLFIVIHQAYELWFKLCLHEIERALDFMEQNEPLKAQHFIKRTVEIFRVLLGQIHILETMRPIDFLGFRDHLMPASGFQSLQFRELEFISGLKDEAYLKYFQSRPEVIERLKYRLASRDLNSAYLKMMNGLGFQVPVTDTVENHEAVLEGIRPIYQNPESHLEVYLLSESLVDLDQALSFWREHHVKVVERVIGFRRGSGGSSGVEYLRSQTAKKAFPYLWEVRSLLKLEK